MRSIFVFEDFENTSEKKKLNNKKTDHVSNSKLKL